MHCEVAGQSIPRIGSAVTLKCSIRRRSSEGPFRVPYVLLVACCSQEPNDELAPQESRLHGSGVRSHACVNLLLRLGGLLGEISLTRTDLGALRLTLTDKR